MASDLDFDLDMSHDLDLDLDLSKMINGVSGDSISSYSRCLLDRVNTI